MTIEDIALQMTPGIGVKGAVHLLEVFGNAERIFDASDDELRCKALLREDIVRNIRRKKGFAPAEREIEHCRTNGIKIIASTDEDYPALLREIPDYPHVIYLKGNEKALGARNISVVGTRNASPYGLAMCEGFIAKLARCIPDLSVVSGLAFGIDVAAHRAALENGAMTVAVLPSALPKIAPVQHKSVARSILENNGALLSEIPAQAPQNGTAYTARNRIIAALSSGCLVVESACSGGSLITAAFANDYFRMVMALPGRATDRTSGGTNHLIRHQKAVLVTSPEEVVEEMGWQMAAAVGGAVDDTAELPLTEEERAVLELLPAAETVSVESLYGKLPLDPGALATVLLGLELAGVVKQLPGNRYIKLI